MFFGFRSEFTVGRLVADVGQTRVTVISQQFLNNTDGRGVRVGRVFSVEWFGCRAFKQLINPRNFCLSHKVILVA